MYNVSPSMTGTPLLVSIALAIFISSLTHTAFRNKFITFHEKPQWIPLEYPKTYLQFQTYGLQSEWDESRAGGELTLQEKVKITLKIHATLIP